MDDFISFPLPFESKHRSRSFYCNLQAPHHELCNISPLPNQWWNRSLANQKPAFWNGRLWLSLNPSISVTSGWHHPFIVFSRSPCGGLNLCRRHPAGSGAYTLIQHVTTSNNEFGLDGFRCPCWENFFANLHRQLLILLNRIMLLLC